MMRNNIILFSLVTGLLGLAFMPTRTELPQQAAKRDSVIASQAGMYYCTMHPDITSKTPGECSKCGMALVKKEADGIRQDKQSSAKDKILQAKRLLTDAKKQLTREGKYDCCIKDPCNQCVLDHQSCPCYENLKADKPVCPECYGGWQRGEGKDKSIKPTDVKTSYSTHKH